MEIYKGPNILILHLKRFKTNKISSIGNFFFTSAASKLSSYIEYPIDGLNLTKYILSSKGKE